MASNYPTSLDTFTNPSANDSLNSPSHALQHANANDAIEALEAKLGIGDSTAGSATSGYVLTAGTGGTTTWSAPSIAGLTLVTAQTVGSAVSSVIVPTVFSSTYDNYKIIYSGGTSSTNGYIAVQLRTGSTTSTSGYYFGMNDVTYGNVQSSEAGSNATSWTYVGYASSTNSFNHLNFDLVNPYATKATVINWSSPTNTWFHQGGGYHSATTSYDSIVITPPGTLTGGTIRVYGYRNS